MENQLSTNQWPEDNQQLQSTTISKTGDLIANIESTCELPKSSFLVSTYKQTKIKEISSEPNFRNILGAILVKISILAGIKNEIDAIVKQDISKMILSTFKDLSLEEIYKAFELERYGSYEEKTEHFQLFDSNYISQVLNKYKKWKVKEKNELNISAPKIEKEITDEEKSKIREELLRNIYHDISTTGFSSDAWHLFADLEASGKIRKSNKEKKELYRQQLKIYEIEERAYIRNKYPASFSLSHTNDLMAKIAGKNPIESVANKCRSLTVAEYLKDRVSTFEEFLTAIKVMP